jgi:cytochrome c556
MRRTMMMAGLACAMVFLAGRLPVYGEDRGDKKTQQVKEMMRKAHKGEASPLALVGTQLKTETPDWILVGQNVKVLSDMADMLRERGTVYYHSPDSYIASARALAKAARAKDRKAAEAAVMGLNQSCSSCHCYYIPR